MGLLLTLFEQIPVSGYYAVETHGQGLHCLSTEISVESAVKM